MCSRLKIRSCFFYSLVSWQASMQWEIAANSLWSLGCLVALYNRYNRQHQPITIGTIGNTSWSTTHRTIVSLVSGVQPLHYITPQLTSLHYTTKDHTAVYYTGLLLGPAEGFSLWLCMPFQHKQGLLRWFFPFWAFWVITSNLSNFKEKV